MINNSDYTRWAYYYIIIQLENTWQASAVVFSMACSVYTQWQILMAYDKTGSGM